MTRIVQAEARERPALWPHLGRVKGGNRPLRRVEVVDVRQSMAHGGGPACLRLRVVAEPACIDPRFLVDDEKVDRIAAVVGHGWPERIAPDELGDARLVAQAERARAALLEELALSELL